jgi:hypothetical protein
VTADQIARMRLTEVRAYLDAQLAFLRRVSPAGSAWRAHGEREPSKTEVLGDYFGMLYDALLASGWTRERLQRHIQQKLAERSQHERYRRERQERDR